MFAQLINLELRSTVIEKIVIIITKNKNVDLDTYISMVGHLRIFLEYAFLKKNRNTELHLLPNF